MGVDFIADKQAKFENRRDAKVEEQLKAETLESLIPDFTALAVRCRGKAGQLPEVGEHVVIAELDEGTLSVLLANLDVGKVLKADAAKLIRRFGSGPRSLLVGTVVESRSLTKIFRVEIHLE